jgi:hypothetical protein
MGVTRPPSKRASPVANPPDRPHGRRRATPVVDPRPGPPQAEARAAAMDRAARKAWVAVRPAS